MIVSFLVLVIILPINCTGSEVDKLMSDPVSQREGGRRSFGRGCGKFRGMWTVWGSGGVMVGGRRGRGPQGG